MQHTWNFASELFVIELILVHENAGIDCQHAEEYMLSTALVIVSPAAGLTINRRSVAALIASAGTGPVVGMRTFAFAT